MQTTKIIAQDNEKGIILADGTIMLQRQGCSTSLNASFQGAHLEAMVFDRSVDGKLSYQDGSFGAQNIQRGKYVFRSDAERERNFPIEFESDVLNYFELHTGRRPKAIRQQIHSYSHGWNPYPYQADDIMLSAFRYDASTRSLRQASTKSPVAAMRRDAATTEAAPFDPSMVIIDSQVEATVIALKKALEVGFHQCDKQKGVDYCMRRLAWLGGCYYEAEMQGKEIHVWVLGHDMEKPAVLTEPNAVAA